VPNPYSSPGLRFETPDTLTSDSTQVQPYETLSWNISAGLCKADEDYEPATRKHPAIGHHCSSLAGVKNSVQLPLVPLLVADMLVHIWDMNGLCACARVCA
jgi:hypothetical protein